MLTSLHLSFRNKLLLLFLTLSVIPLIVVAFIVSNTVQTRYKDTLAKSFTTSVDSREKILNYYLEGNKSWIKSIAAQDLLLAEMEKYSIDAKYSGNRVFASLVSLRRENQFIDRIYVTNTKGIILASTTTDDEGKNVSDLGIEYNPRERSPTYLTVRNTTDKKRIITLASPFIQRNNGEIIGHLIVEYNASVVKSLIDGSLYNSKSIINSDEKDQLGNTYIIDQDGYLLTSITGTNIERSQSVDQFINCNQSIAAQTGFWTNKNGDQVFGSYKCSTIDSMRFIYVVEQETRQAFAVSNNVRNTIGLVTFSISILLIVSIIKVASSVTNPLKKLTQGAQEIGKGNFNTKFSIKTDDELQDLANSFTDMSTKISDYIKNLEQQEGKLNEINLELEKEKETISAERNKLEVIIAGITDAVIAVDLDRKVIICNKSAQELLGLPQNEIIGSPIRNLIHLESEDTVIDEKVFCPIRTDEFEGVIYNNEDMLLKTKQKNTQVHLITGKIKEGVNVNLGCILTFHDKSKEAELEEMKLDFVSMAAHELRTPITSIRGYSNLLSEEFEESNDSHIEDWKVLIKRISISSEQLLALVENLLNVTKIEKGILSISVKEENWKSCVEEVVNVFKERAESKQITLSVKNIEDNLIANVDKLRINEVLTNLVSNAITYTPNGGSVTVESHASSDGGWIETSVSDNGKGIPKSAQSHLFQKFFRVTGPLEQGSKGNGLGLYISKSIVEMHGGKIWVESDDGKGAKFTYTIPRATK